MSTCHHTYQFRRWHCHIDNTAKEYHKHKMLWTILTTARINSHGRAPHIWSLSFIQWTVKIFKLINYHTCRAFTPVASHSEKRVIWNTSILITWGTVAPKIVLMAKTRWWKRLPSQLDRTWQPITNHRASVARFWQLYKVRIITLCCRM